jgi:hypothetical protein
MLNTTLPELRLTLDLAQRVDRAEFDLCALAGAFGTPVGFASLEVGGGRALFGTPRKCAQVLSVLGIAGTSTLPAFRRWGVQTAITIQAMADAVGEADIATATTAPGSTSQRTFERVGFQVLYNRAILIKSFS